MQKQPFANVLQNRRSYKFRNIHKKTLVLEPLFDKVAGLQVFSCEYSEIFKSSFFIEHPRWLLLQMFCFTLYFQKDVAECIVVIHCHSMSFVVPFIVNRCHSLYHSLSFVVTRCHSLSLVVPLVVIRCHSLSFVVTRCTTRCHLLSLDVPLVCLFINDLFYIIKRSGQKSKYLIRF